MSSFKRKHVDTKVERQILTGMITSTKFLRGVVDNYNKHLISSTFVRLVASWCLDYFAEHEEAPGLHIQDIYEEEKERSHDEAQMELIASFLDKLSQNYEITSKTNASYLITKTEKHFRRKQLEVLSKEIKIALELEDLETAEQLVVDFHKLETPAAYGIELFKDPETVRRSFEEDTESIIKMPGALGDYLNSHLGPACLVGIMGMEKIGKTFNLMELALRGFQQRKNIVFVQAGDMTESQQYRRICIRIAKRNYKLKYCGRQYIPTIDCEWNQLDTCNKDERQSDVGLFQKMEEFTDMIIEGKKEEMVEEAVEDGYSPCAVCRTRNPKAYKGATWYYIDEIEPLSWREAYRLGTSFVTQIGSKKNFKLLSYPNDSFTIAKLYTHLDIWEQQNGFVPDGIFLDYPDIFAPEPGSPAEERHKQNQTWKSTRQLSQVKNCLVVAPTQADANAYGRKSLGMSNYSEDKRKYSHVTSMITLNQTEEEKRAGIMRYGQLFVRDDDMDRSRQVKVLQHLGTGRPYLGSYF